MRFASFLSGAFITAIVVKPPERKFSIVMGADYSFKVKNIEIWARVFFKHNNSFLAIVLMSVRTKQFEPKSFWTYTRTSHNTRQANQSSAQKNPTQTKISGFQDSRL